MIQCHVDNALPFVSEPIWNTYRKNAEVAMDLLNRQKNEPASMLGWMNLEDLQRSVDEINQQAEKLSEICDVVVVIGIGGSYLGAKAIIEALKHPFVNSKTELIFAGYHLDTNYHKYLLRYLEKKSFGIVVISKSGTTTEPAVAFRLLRLLLEKKEGKKAAAERIVAITDKQKGVLRRLAEEQNYTTFEIPDSIGGRFSVLSPVGLFPIALAGHSITELLKGAKAYKDGKYVAHLQYAAIRNTLYQEHYSVELMGTFFPSLNYLAEWWKQLFGESEGKEGKGLFPASAIFTTDLHSLGQFIQEGTRLLFETIISVNQNSDKLYLPEVTTNDDELNYLSGKSLFEINSSAEKGTILAHTEGKVPVLKIEMETINEFNLGALIYFFELSCAVSGTILGVNPFNQPGVEAYKRNMFALLKKPGYENKL